MGTVGSPTHLPAMRWAATALHRGGGAGDRPAEADGVEALVQIKGMLRTGGRPRPPPPGRTTAAPPATTEATGGGDTVPPLDAAATTGAVVGTLEGGSGTGAGAGTSEPAGRTGGSAAVVVRRRTLCHMSRHRAAQNTCHGRFAENDDPH